MNKVHLTVQDLMLVMIAAQMMRDNLDKHYTIRQLAGMINISEKKLKRGFMNQFGKGVYTYLRCIRMQQIELMLMEDLPLKAIARITGYKSQTALIKAFRREHGVSPSFWKKRQDNKIA